MDFRLKSKEYVLINMKQKIRTLRITRFSAFFYHYMIFFKTHLEINRQTANVARIPKIVFIILIFIAPANKSAI